MGYIYFRQYSTDKKNKHRRWAVMTTHTELRLYKNYIEYYRQDKWRKKISLENYVLEEYREVDDEGGLYIRLRVGLETMYELWMEKLIDYKLWVEFLESRG